MNLKILLLIFSAAAISSCTTTYKSGQTPDDVYYSPAREIEASENEEKKQERPVVKNETRDRQLIMSIYDRRWRNFGDDYDAYYDPYRYGYNCGYYYNPYYYPCPVYISGATFVNPKNTVPRMTNLGSYNYSNMVVVNPKVGSSTLIKSTRTYNNSNSNQYYIRRVITPTYTPSGNSSTNQSYQPAENNTRTYSPSKSSSSSSSSSGSSSGTPVARPRRGG